MTKKRILILFLAIVSLYLLWTVYELAAFRMYGPKDGRDDPLEIRGVYHVHTTLSDGRADPEKVIRKASRASLDFLILTDHGDPNRESMDLAGWRQGVLVLAGSELSVSRGHLVALGFRMPKASFSQNSDLAAFQIQALDGFSVIAHPYSKVSWSWGGDAAHQGMEIINANTMWKNHPGRLLPYSIALVLRPTYALIKMLDRPEKNLEKWDSLNQEAPIFGYYSVDAHLLYRPLFSFLNLHVLLRKPLSRDFDEASRQVFTALRKGRFYNAVEAAARAGGFRFLARRQGKQWAMGEVIRGISPVTLEIRAEFPYSFEVHLLHNGRDILVTSEKHITLEVRTPGSYRVEVYLREKTPLREDIPWILSNPITLKEASR